MEGVNVMIKGKTFIVIILCAMLVGCGILSQPAQGAQQTSVATAEPAATAKPADTETAAAADPTSAADPTASPTKQPAAKPTAAPAPTQINIMAVGDIMFHYPEVQGAYNKKTKSYDFNYSFQYLKDILSSADIAMGNFECTLGGPKKSYSLQNSKSFSAPDSAADALKNAGFDVLSNANNHCNDRGRDGLIRTNQVMTDKGLTCIGTRQNTSDKPYSILDVKGVKIGFTAYTFNSRNNDLVNSYSTSNLSGQIAKMDQIVQDMRNDGAEFIVFFIHWGTEYQRSPGSAQKKIAQGLADAGVDVIFGSHPHWMQSVDMLTGAKTGKKTFVAYSLGNFISNQRTEFNPEFKYSEDNMILDVKVTKQPDGSVELSNVQYIPTWTFMFTTGGLRRYIDVPLQQALAAPKDFGITTKRDVGKAQKSWDNTQAMLKDAVSKGVVTLMDTGK